MIPGDGLVTCIKSPDNRIIKTFKSLTMRKYREKSGLFPVEGIKLVEEALISGYDLEFVILTEKILLQIPNIINRLEQKNVPVYSVSEPFFNRISETVTPQGIAAAVVSRKTDPESLINSVQNPIFVVVDRIQDPGNLGSIIRSADAAGAHGVFILKGSADAYNPKTVRATMGSIFHIPVLHIGEQTVFLDALKTSHIKLLITSIQAKLPVFKTDLTCPLAVVFGNESFGISAEIIRIADVSVKIPIAGQAESYNVAAAAGIVLYEVMRQRMQSHVCL